MAPIRLNDLERVHETAAFKVFKRTLDHEVDMPEDMVATFSTWESVRDAASKCIDQLTYRKHDLETLVFPPRGSRPPQRPKASSRLSADVDSSATVASASPDRLSSLPLEIFSMISAWLDLRSLMRMSSVNKFFRSAVYNYPPLRALSARQCLFVSAVQATAVAAEYSLGQIINQIAARDCESCGDFGPFLHLPTLAPVCYLCLIERDQFMMMTRSHARRSFALPSEAMNALPTFKALPGFLPQLGKRHDRRRRFYDIGMVYEKALQHHGSLLKLKDALAKGDASQLRCEPYSSCIYTMDAKIYDYQGADRLINVLYMSEPGLSCRGCNRWSDNAPVAENSQEASAIILGISFDLDFSPLDNPDVLENFDFDSFLNADPDQFSFDPLRDPQPLNRRRTFTVSGFLNHLHECPPSRSRLLSLLSKSN